jgi:hypothetical protein
MLSEMESSVYGRKGQTRATKLSFVALLIAGCFSLKGYSTKPPVQIVDFLIQQTKLR